MTMNNKPLIQVINGKRDGFVGEDIIYIGRANQKRKLKASPLANPFPISKARSRSQSVAEYKAWLWKQVEAWIGGSKPSPAVQELIRIAGLADMSRAVKLACYCKPELCHGDVVVRAVELVLEYFDHFIPPHPPMDADFLGTSAEKVAFAINHCDAENTFYARIEVSLYCTENKAVIWSIKGVTLRPYLSPQETFLAHGHDKEQLLSYLQDNARNLQGNPPEYYLQMIQRQYQQWDSKQENSSLANFPQHKQLPFRLGLENENHNRTNP